MLNMCVSNEVPGKKGMRQSGDRRSCAGILQMRSNKDNIFMKATLTNKTNNITP